MKQHRRAVSFGVRFERLRKVDKSKPTRKLKHANSILEYFEYFCQMSPKSILIILSYTVSNLARFFLRRRVIGSGLTQTFTEPFDWGSKLKGTQVVLSELGYLNTLIGCSCFTVSMNGQGK